MLYSLLYCLAHPVFVAVHVHGQAAILPAIHTSVACARFATAIMHTDLVVRTVCSAQCVCSNAVQLRNREGDLIHVLFSRRPVVLRPVLFSSSVFSGFQAKHSYLI